jgi:hypothetical protein
MTRMIQTFLYLFLVVALASPLAAKPAWALEGALMKGKSLQALCNSRKAEDLFSCQSYIAGIIDYQDLLKSLGSAPTVDFCIPRPTTMAQIKQVVLQYIAVHTEHQDFIAAPGVAMALYNAYPCTRPAAVKKRWR